MKTKLMAATKTEAVRAVAAPHSQAIETTSEPGAPDATRHEVVQGLRRPEGSAAGIGLGIGLAGVENGKSCIKTPDYSRYTLVYSYFSPPKMPPRSRFVKPLRDASAGVHPGCVKPCVRGPDHSRPNDFHGDRTVAVSFRGRICRAWIQGIPGVRWEDRRIPLHCSN